MLLVELIALNVTTAEQQHSTILFPCLLAAACCPLLLLLWLLFYDAEIAVNACTYIEIGRVKCGKNGMFSFPNNESESQLKAYLNGNLGIVR